MVATCNPHGQGVKTSFIFTNIFEQFLCLFIDSVTEQLMKERFLNKSFLNTGHFTVPIKNGARQYPVSNFRLGNKDLFSLNDFFSSSALK
jgi:hypothetical protein